MVGLVVLSAIVLFTTVSGCGDDARLAEHDIPHLEVETVTDQGVELGPEADPKDVAYVLLRAIRDDVLAGDDRQARRHALARQSAVCDPDYIFDLYQQVMGARAVYDRDQWVYKKVGLWAPTLAYYVGSFDFDLATARAQMVASPTGRRENWPGQTVQVDLPVRAPNPTSGSDVVVRIRLHKHQAAGHWRVFHVGFASKRVPGRPSTPATQPAAIAAEPEAAPGR